LGSALLPISTEADIAMAPSPGVSDASSVTFEPSPAAPSADVGPREFDIDAVDAGDQFAVTEYTPEIYAYLRIAEVEKSQSDSYNIFLSNFCGPCASKF
jgi:hypothetical protein